MGEGLTIIVELIVELKTVFSVSFWDRNALICRLQTAQNEIDRLRIGWEEAEGIAEELEEEIQMLVEQKGRMRQQMHDGDCQVRTRSRG